MTLDRSGVTVRRCRQSEIGAASRVLAAAFHEDPFMQWLFPDSAARPALLEQWMRVTAKASHDCGHALVAVGAGTDVAAAALWAPPEHDLYGGDRFDAIWSLALGANPDRATDLRDGFGAVGSIHPRATAHYYLNMIGVDPSQRSRGLGAQLIRHTLDVADTEGEPTYLESANPRNHSFYARHGFTAGEPAVLSDGVTMTPMWREPGAGLGARSARIDQG